MPLPSGLSTFTISFGPYLDLEGNVAFSGVQGKLSVSPAIVDSTSGALIFKSVDFYIDNAGTASVGPLVANDDPRINQGSQYTVEWQVRSSLPSPPNKTFVVPVASGASIDYDLLASATGTAAGPYVLPLVTSVSGRSGAVTLTKTDVGLGSVDNTADANKPVSTAQAAALAAKSNIADVGTAGTATGDALRAAYLPKWKASTAYALGEPVLNPSGQTVTANAAFTSGTTYSAANWTVSSGGRVRTVTTAFAATVTPNADATDVLNVGALTGNLTLANPTGTPIDGQNLRLRLAQDATGSRTITFGTAYAFGTDVTAALIPSAASAKWEMLFTWNATDSKWRATAIVRGF